MKNISYDCTHGTFRNVSSVAVANGKLLVSDSGLHRVLIWNSIPTTNGVLADLVLGQANFTSCDPNRNSSPTKYSLDTPFDVWTDGTKVVVAEGYNNRVLIWNSFPTQNGQGADLVLGQNDFTSYVSQTTRSGFDFPNSVNSNGTQLFVRDSVNRRVLIWNTFPTQNNQPADVVIGQADFTSVTAGTSDLYFEGSNGMGIDSRHLYIPDVNSNRVLVFESE